MLELGSVCCHADDKRSYVLGYSGPNAGGVHFCPIPWMPPLKGKGYLRPYARYLWGGEDKFRAGLVNV